MSVGVISFVLLLILCVIFGKLFILQFRIWMLAKNGYKMIRHIGEDKIERNIFARPKESHFDFSNGFYHYIPETITRMGDLLAKVSPSLVKKLKESNGAGLNSDDEELFKLFCAIKDLNYERKYETLGWGIPVITYYGSNPDPVDFSDRKKTYGSGVIRDMYLRLMLTKEYGWIRKMMTLTLICLVVIGGVLILYFVIMRTNSQTLGACTQLLNVTTTKCLDMLNSTLPHAVNSTIRL
jgi:hypothetical protein